MEVMLYPLVLITHLLSAIVFTALVFINTYVIQRINPNEDSDLLGMASDEMKRHVKRVMHISIGILLCSGIYLLSFHLDAMRFSEIYSFAMGLKVILAVIVALLFFMMPYIIRQLRHKSIKDIQILNRFLFGSVVTIIVLAKLVLFV